MIYSANFSSITELVSYMPEGTPAEGDLLFAYVSREFTDYVPVCGMFKLYEDFSTSGETHDGIKIIASTSLSDMYWDRILDEGFAWYETAPTFVAYPETLTLTHASDPAPYKRIPQVFEVTTSAGDSGTLDVDTPSYTVHPVSSLTDKWCFYNDSGVGKIQLEYLDLIIDTEITPPTGLTSVSSTHTFDLSNEDLCFICVISGVTKFCHMAANGTYTITSPPPKYGRVKINGNIASAQTYDSTGSLIYVYSYSSPGDSWTELACLSIWEDHYFGSGGWIQTSGNDWYGTWDEPPTGSWWGTYQAFPQLKIAKASYPGFNQSNAGVGHRNSTGVAYEIPWARETLLLNVSYPIDPDDRELYLYDTDYSGYDNILSYSGTGTISLWYGYDDDSWIIAKVSWDTIAYRYRVFSVTASGDKISDMSSSGSVYATNVKKEATGETALGDEIGTDTNFYIYSNILSKDNAGYYILEGSNCWLGVDPIGGVPEIICGTHAIKLSDPTFHTGVSSNNLIMYPLNGDKVLIYSADTGRMAVAHWGDRHIYYESIYLYKPATTGMQDALSIDDVTITCIDKTGCICRFLLADENENFYRWNGTTWVVTTNILTGNTKAEMEAADHDQARTDIGNKIGIVVVLETDGTDTPEFTSIVFDYTTAGYKTARHYSALASIDIVSDTQTRITNLTSDNTFMLRVLIP